MSEETLIEWASHTGGPYLGCSEVSTGCLHCYARELALSRLERIFRAAYEKAGFADWETRPVWGAKATRVLTRGFWDQAFTLNRRAQKSGQAARMFPSMIDWLDEMPAGIIDQDGQTLHPDQVLGDFLKVVRDCSHLTWLLLTKRPENFAARMKAARDWHFDHGDRTVCDWLSEWRLDGKAPAHVWIGTTTEDQTRADQRIPELLKIPAVVRFLSVEPMVGPVDLERPMPGPSVDGICPPWYIQSGIDWVICGGESGHGARPMHPVWARSMRDQCQDAGVPFFFKQWGAWLPEHQVPSPKGDTDTGSRGGQQEAAKPQPATMERTIPVQQLHTFEDGTRAFRVGKINAGALLDGVAHKEFPKGAVHA